MKPLLLCFRDAVLVNTAIAIIPVIALPATAQTSTPPALPDTENLISESPLADLVAADAVVADAVEDSAEDPTADNTPAIELPELTSSSVEIQESGSVEALPDGAIAVDALSQPDPYSIGQVTSVNQLSDVQPTDWAYQALQSLVERYGCIAGYPDGTYRGRNFLTRYEFAAGLNACLDRIVEIYTLGSEGIVTAEDLAVLQRLQEEFAAELATLRGRVDTLEARVAELEVNQFSTTTRLNGETIFALYSILDGDRADGDSADSVPAFGYRVRLNLETSTTTN